MGFKKPDWPTGIGLLAVGARLGWKYRPWDSIDGSKDPIVYSNTFTVGVIRLTYEGGDSDSRSYALENCTEETVAKAFKAEGYEAIAHGYGYRMNKHVLIKNGPPFQKMTIYPSGEVTIDWDSKPTDGSKPLTLGSLPEGRFKKIAETLHRAYKD